MDDDQKIRERIERYCDAVNRRDGAAWIACWWPDAVWMIHDRRVEGAQTILSTWETAMAGYAHIHFFAQIGSISRTDDRAILRVYTTEYLTTTEGAQRLQVGEYDDVMLRQDGDWRFTQRSYRVREQRHVPSG